jgi:hypothetical protein
MARAARRRLLQAVDGMRLPASILLSQQNKAPSDQAGGVSFRNLRYDLSVERAPQQDVSDPRKSLAYRVMDFG